MKTMSAYVFFILIFVNNAFSKNLNARCFQQVYSQIEILKISDLNFGEDIQGSPEKTIFPDITENNSNASFKIQGEKNKEFKIKLPEDNTIQMRTALSKEDLSKLPINYGIPVNQFKTNIESYFLDFNGQKNIYIGATRSALQLNQALGFYEGEFIIEVVY